MSLETISIEYRSWKMCRIKSLTRYIAIPERLSKTRETFQMLISLVQLLLIFIEKLGDTLHKLNEEIQDVRQNNFALEKDLKEKVNFINAMEIQFDEEKKKLLDEKDEFENKLITIKVTHEKLRVEHEEALFDLGKLSVERAANINETKKARLFEEIFPPKESSSYLGVRNESDHTSTTVSSTNTSGQVQHFPHDPEHFSKSKSNSHSHVSSNSSTSGDSSIVTEDRDRSVQNLAYAVQEEESGEREPISLRNEPRSSVTSVVYNAYKLLLVTISSSLLFSDIVILKNWANEQFSVETNMSVVEILFHLDQNGAINAMDLSLLTAFFESILRYDLVLLIEKFCSGDYVALKNMTSMSYRRNRSRNCARAVDVNQVHSSRVLGSNTNVDNNVNNAQVLERTSIPNDHNVSSNVNYSETIVRDNLGLNSKSFPNVRGNRMTASGNSDVVADGPIVNSKRGNRNDTVSYEIPKTSTEASRIGKFGSSRLSSKNSDIRNHHTNRDVPSGSQPGNHFQRSKTGSDEEDKWLCNHYKRRCFVKFECCKTFWPCHRCHNSESTCGRDKLKSRDTKMVKCVECGKEQQFGENGQFCIQCDTKFAEFYCGQCKHLTGMDDFPYHCEKCGICRIHGDRSFHCDVCGVCLDVQLRGNHKCRPDSAHDECCICLEDAFTGCQILPCSHKVHKNCATRMIQSGITRCPICRESFAHKLERRPPSKRITRKNVRHYNGNKH